MIADFVVVCRNVREVPETFVLTEKDLKRTRNELEVRVEERTAELTETNRHLLKEVERRESVEENERGLNVLLDSINRIQSQYIADAKPSELFDDLLNNILSLTGSEYGFIGQVLYTEKGEPYLKTHASAG